MTTNRPNRRDYDLRDWLYRLDSTNRLAVIKPGTSLKFELAGIANRLDGCQASYFPNPSGHNIPVVSGLISDRGWMAESLGLEEAELVPAFQDAVANAMVCANSRTPSPDVSARFLFLSRSTASLRAKNVARGRYPAAYIRSTTRHHATSGASDEASKRARRRKTTPNADALF